MCRATAHEHADAYARLLLDGAPQRKRPPAINARSDDARAVFELAFHQAAQHKTAELTSLTREATYLALAPYVGVSEAAEVAA